MYQSTVKKSNVIINPFKKINNENIQKKQNTFLLDENNNKKINVPKNNTNRQLIYTKSDIEFHSKYNDDYNGITKNKIKINETHNIKKEAFLQKLKDMIFSPGDINYNERETELNNNNHLDNNILNSSNRTKSSDKLFDLKKKENGAKNNNITKYNIKGMNMNNINNKRLALLPNKLDNRKTLVLDLDETLIHSAFEKFTPKDDITLNMKIKNEEYIIHVLKRPYLDEFLKIVTQKYEVVIFTASISDYANPLLDQLDPFNKISYRLFREHCTRTDNGLFIKDLNKLGRNLKDVIIIDNNPVSYTLNKMNGLPILTWHSIQSDNELIKLIPLLLYLTNVGDIRVIINKVVNGYYVNYKEVNKIIKNNNLLNNNKEEDDYFNNWFVSKNKKKEKKNNENNSIKINKQKDKDKDKYTSEFEDKNKKQKESVKQIIKYKGLLGSEDKFNFDNYKKAHHIKMFSGFLENDITDKKENNKKNEKKSNNYKEDNNKSNLIDIEKKNVKDNSILIFNQKIENKRNNSSKHLFKINKKLNNLFNEPENNNNNLFYQKEITPIKNNKSKEIIFKFDYNNNSKLNITDTNININRNYRNIVMNNKTNIINNNIYQINNKSSMINANNNTIEHSSRNILNKNKNSTFKYGYQSANYFFNKKERSESTQYNQRKNKNILYDLIDNLINYNKNNKKKNIDSNQLIAISNNNQYLNNDKNTHNMNNLILNNVRTGRDLYDKYNSRNKEKFNTEEENKNIINAFLNNKINISNISNINSIDNYKKINNNVYLNTGNNYENYIQKNKKRSFLYEENNSKYNNKIINDLTNLRLNDHHSNMRQNRTIKYLFPTSNYKIDI